MEELERIVSSEEDRRWCVYIHRNKINNKAYIGITSQDPERRWRNGEGYHSDQYVFYRAIEKYGWNSFEHIIWGEGLTEDEAKKLEVQLIGLFQTNCLKHRNPEYGYNMTNGGDGTGRSGHPMSEETKQKLRDLFTGREVSQEQRDKISASLKLYYEDEDNRKKQSELAKIRFENPENRPMLGRHHSEESKRKMSDAKKGKYDGENHPMYGKHHSEESKQKMSENRKGKRPSEETIEKMRESHKGKLLGENSPCSKQVLQFEKNGVFVREFGSLREIERILGYNKTPIMKCCNHKKHYNTAYGFLWEYKENYDPSYDYVNEGHKQIRTN